MIEILTAVVCYGRRAEHAEFAEIRNIGVYVKKIYISAISRYSSEVENNPQRAQRPLRFNSCFLFIKAVDY